MCQRRKHAVFRALALGWWVVYVLLEGAGDIFPLGERGWN